MRRETGYLRDSRGFVLILSTVSLVAVLSLSSLAIDLGYIFVTKSELQNAADAAALASVAELPNGLASATEKALNFGQFHKVAGSPIGIKSEDIHFGNYDLRSLQFQQEEGPINSVEVKAERTTDALSGPLPLFFAKIFGVNFANVRALSRAALDRRVIGVGPGKSRLIPYSVIDFVVDEDRDGNFDLGKVINIHPRVDAPGNFGFLDLDGGSNDIPELRQYIEEGYDKEFIIPPGGSLGVYGSPGISGQSLLDSFEKILGQVVFLPVHDRADLQGSPAVFNEVDFLAVRIQAVQLTGKLEDRYIQVEIVSFASSTLVAHPDAPENNSLARPRLVP